MSHKLPGVLLLFAVCLLSAEVSRAAEAGTNITKRIVHTRTIPGSIQKPINEPQVPINKPQASINKPQVPINKPQAPIIKPHTPITGPPVPLSRPPRNFQKIPVLGSARAAR